MAKTGKFIRSLLALSFFLTGSFAVRASDVSVPHFDLAAMDGKRYTEQDLLGRPTLVAFWASWCPVCQVELPKLHALFEENKGRGLRVLTIGFADEEENIRRYVLTHSSIFDFPVLYDPQDGTAKRFGVFGTPTIYLINKRGEIEYVTWLIEDPALKDELEDLLEDESRGAYEWNFYHIDSESA